MAITQDRTWMWHPGFTETRQDTVGLFVYFRKDFATDADPPRTLCIQIAADTNYRLYVLHHFITFGPVKGDRNLCCFDDVDLAPYLVTGRNIITVVVLRLFHATPYAASCPRLRSGDPRIVLPEGENRWRSLIESSTSWETAIDATTLLRIDQPEDHFLHVYEATARPAGPLAGGAQSYWNTRARLATLRPGSCLHV